MHKPGTAIAKADTLSRLPLFDKEELVEDIYYFSTLTDLPVTAKNIQCATDRDKLPKSVRNIIWHGWPKGIPNELQPFWFHRLELAVDNGCIVWNNRVVIPESLQAKLFYTSSIWGSPK